MWDLFIRATTDHRCMPGTLVNTALVLLQEIPQLGCKEEPRKSNCMIVCKHDDIMLHWKPDHVISWTGEALIRHISYNNIPLLCSYNLTRILMLQEPHYDHFQI